MDSLDALLPIAVRATAIASRLMRQQGPGALTPKGIGTSPPRWISTWSGRFAHS